MCEDIEVENFNLCVFIDAVSWSLLFMFSLEWFIDWSLVLNTGAWMFDVKPYSKEFLHFLFNFSLSFITFGFKHTDKLYA